MESRDGKAPSPMPRLLVALGSHRLALLVAVAAAGRLASPILSPRITSPLQEVLAVMSLGHNRHRHPFYVGGLTTRTLPSQTTARRSLPRRSAVLDVIQPDPHLLVSPDRLLLGLPDLRALACRPWVLLETLD